MTKDSAKTCLVVDDSRVVRKVARRIVEDLGFTCREAEDGQKAYDACRETMPDAILLDWKMPVMDGIEFLGKLRQMKNGSHPKVILCTILNDTKSVKRAIDAGADEFIMKPFDNEVIETKLTIVGLVGERG